jgi:undecaprenyl-diphosphatase
VKGWDLELFRAINGWPDSYKPFLGFFSQAFNYLSVKILVAALVIGMIWAGGRARRTVVLALVAVGIANFSTDRFKEFLPQHRPFQVLQDCHLRAGWAPSFGTASAHAANMAAVACVFTLGLRYWGVPWILVAIFTGFSRVYVGVHYPHQVLLGWACGIVSGILVTKSWDWLARRRKTVESGERDGKQSEAQTS